VKGHPTFARGHLLSGLVGVASAIAGASALAQCGGSVAGTADSGARVEGDGASSAGCANPLGGAPCDPGYVECDATRCSTTAGEFCCADQPSLGCYSQGSSPTSATCDAPVYCNEAADCPSGTVCCGHFICPGAVPDCDLFAQQRCLADCDGGFGKGEVAWQACRGNDECPSGTCVLQLCQSGSAPSAAVEACELIPPWCSRL
jgi:hypothetical protein